MYNTNLLASYSLKPIMKCKGYGGPYKYTYTA